MTKAEQIAALADEWGRSSSDDETQRIVAFCKILLDWNRRINLTGARTFSSLVDEHLVDAFALSRIVPRDSSMVDVGAGSGLPSLPFHVIRPDCALTLVEPRVRRAAFLRAALREIGSAGPRVVQSRLDRLDLEPQDAAMSRATFSPAEWLRLGQKLARPGGLVVVFAKSPDEIGDGQSHLSISIEYLTPVTGRHRWIGAVRVA